MAKDELVEIVEARCRAFKYEDTWYTYYQERQDDARDFALQLIADLKLVQLDDDQTLPPNPYKPDPRLADYETRAIRQLR